MVNTETMQLLREHWLKWASFTQPDAALLSSRFTDLYPNELIRLRIPFLAISLGPHFTDSHIVMSLFIHNWRTTELFYHEKVADMGETGKLNCNPLISYSFFGGQKQPIHPFSHPYAGLHLASILPTLVQNTAVADDSWVPPSALVALKDVREIKSTLKALANEAPTEFLHWCAAFRRIARRTLETDQEWFRIRFFVGDAITFCSALARVKDGKKLNCYSRPFRICPLDLNGDLPLPDDRAPKFNVVDTSTLLYDLGAINLLTVCLPLLAESPSTVLFMESFRVFPDNDETPLLPDILQTDKVRSICTLLNLLPTSFITGISTTSTFGKGVYTKCSSPGNDGLVVPYPRFNRLAWRFAMTRPDRRSPDVTTTCKPESLAEFLFQIYRNMFKQETGEYIDFQRRQMEAKVMSITFDPSLYTRNAIVALLAFLKPRIYVDWAAFMEHFLKLVDEDKSIIVGKNHIHELFLHLHLSGVHSVPRLAHPLGLVVPGARPLSPRRYYQGILKDRLQPPPITAMIVTVPRKSVQPIYDVTMTRPFHKWKTGFQIFLISNGRPDIFSSIHPVFGKLKLSNDDAVAMIEVDNLGWHGQSDLHLLVYVPTYLLVSNDPKHMGVRVHLAEDFKTRHALQSVFPSMEPMIVFQAPGGLLDRLHVHLLRSLPGLAVPTKVAVPKLYVPRIMPTRQLYKWYAELRPETEKLAFQIEFEMVLEVPMPHCYILEPTAITVFMDQEKSQIKSPFPLAGTLSDVDTEIIKDLETRTHRRFQVLADLRHPQSPPSFTNNSFFFSPWNIPYVNFSRLQKIHIDSAVPAYRTDYFKYQIRRMFSKTGWTQIHDRMKSDVKKFVREMNLIPATNLATVKWAIMHIFVGFIYNLCNVFTFAISWAGERQAGKRKPEIAIFVNGMYVDTNARTYILEAHILPLGTVSGVPKLERSLENLHKKAVPIRMSREQFSLWAHYLRAAAERGRNWEHKDDCQFNTSGDEARAIVCSCGQGKAGESFGSREWEAFGGYVTRLTIMPIFLPSFLEGRRLEKCLVCGKDGKMSCSQCKKAMYCSTKCRKHDPGNAVVCCYEDDYGISESELTDMRNVLLSFSKD
jgi:hypothetical protein